MSGQRGMTLIELLIAMTIGLLLIGGAFMVFIEASGNQRTNEQISRMQENARFALGVIKPDLRLASYWGMLRDTTYMLGHKGSASQLAALTGDCADRWYVDLANPVFATNGANPYALTCLPAAEYKADSDILVVRHAAAQPSAALDDDLIYIRSDRLRASVFVGDTEPTNEFSGDEQDYRLVTHAYYVRPYSFAVGDGEPSLRRIVLADGGAAPGLVHEEVIPGIEDLQVQYGVDDDGDGSVNRYVDPDTGLGGGDLIAVRVWLLARAARPETAFTDDHTYLYGNRSYTPNDGFRRMLLTATVQVRNLGAQ